MAGWHVEYEKPGSSEIRAIYLRLPDEYTTARAVRIAIETGKVADVKVRPGSLVLVQHHNSNTMGAA
jgi:hypothetical protein